MLTFLKQAKKCRRRMPSLSFSDIAKLIYKRKFLGFYLCPINLDLPTKVLEKSSFGFLRIQFVWKLGFVYWGTMRPIFPRYCYHEKRKWGAIKHSSPCIHFNPLSMQMCTVLRCTRLHCSLDCTDYYTTVLSSTALDCTDYYSTVFYCSQVFAGKANIWNSC